MPTKLETKIKQRIRYLNERKQLNAVEVAEKDMLNILTSCQSEKAIKDLLSKHIAHLYLSLEKNRYQPGKISQQFNAVFEVVKMIQVHEKSNSDATQIYHEKSYPIFSLPMHKSP
ncbi:MAG: hypothetical protein AAGB12_12885 [Pseudomonadota bacterium]